MDRETEAILNSIEAARAEVRKALSTATDPEHRHHLQQLERDLNCQISYNRR